MGKVKANLDTGRTEPIEFTAHGEPASKANSRRLVLMGGKIRSIKSQKALDYLVTFKAQCPTLDPMFTGDVGVDITIYYASRRPDLDESVILDAMQGQVYTNDRQVKDKRIRWGLDPECPRSVIRVYALESGA